MGGTISLAVASGLNLPYFAVKLALNEKIPSKKSFKKTKMIRYWKEFFQNGNKSFELSQLYNTKINPLNPYRNRYIIGDLNTVNKIGESRGIIESYFEIQNSWEFKILFEFTKKYQINQDSILLLTPDKIRNLKLDSVSKKDLIHQLQLFQNYYRTVGQYQEEEMIIPNYGWQQIVYFTWDGMPKRTNIR